jgi:hypothetical protein
MENLFVTYEQALALKELGFDEPCIGFYYRKEIDLFESCKIQDRRNSSYVKNYMDEEDCTAPLKQQVFKWFRDEYKLYAEINLDSYKEPYSLKVTIKKMDATNTYVEKEFYPYANSIGAIDNDKYEEAESECIDKLIEIIKGNYEKYFYTTNRPTK